MASRSRIRTKRLQIARQLGDRRGEAIACWNLGEAYIQLADLSQGLAALQAAADIEREVGDPDAERDAAKVEAIKARHSGMTSSSDQEGPVQ